MDARRSYNESLRKSERHLRFDVRELKRLTARSVNKSERDVIRFTKLAEGDFNRVFQASISDVVSEVATMDCLRSHGIPVPKIQGFLVSSDNIVGAEYIIMKMLEGSNIGDHWYSMTEDERLKIIFQIADIEGKLFSIRLPTFQNPTEANAFTLALIRVSADGTRSGHFSALTGARSPLPSRFSKPGAMKEKEYLTKCGHDRYPRNRLAREIFNYQKQSPRPYMQGLEDFLLIAGQICPREDSFLSLPTIHHPDLSPNNIFVSGSFEITGLIDWQHSSVLPLFLQCGIPAYFQNYGDDLSESMAKPELPENFNELDENQQSEALETFQKRQLHFYYMAATVKHNNVHFDALWEDFVVLKQKFFSHTSSPWEGDNATLRVDLLEAARNWPKIVTPPGADAGPHCPITYSPAEVEECLELYHNIQEMDEQQETTMESLGMGGEGWVPSARYDLVKALEAKMKEQALEFAESELERQMLERH